MSEERSLGVYIHIPFCETRCDYCAFSTWTDKSGLIDDYLDACRHHLDDAHRRGELTGAGTVFFGGGTPSLVGAHRLVRLLEVIDLERDAEVTVECNPESVSPEMLAELHAGGVTRISLGVQSLRRHVLSGLGRVGDPDVSRRALAEIAAVGFSSFSVDLIYGGAGESDDDFASGLCELLDGANPPPHLSVYALTVERSTPLFADRSRHPDDDELADRYVLCDEICSSHGLSWYEVSNWARDGHECRHNENYWRGGNYVGIGCAAHGHDDGRRYRNVGTPERYIEAIRHGHPTVASEERLDQPARELESLELALRTRRGVRAGALEDDPALCDLVEEHAGRVVLTRKGRLLTNEVTIRLRIDGDDEKHLAGGNFSRSVAG